MERKYYAKGDYLVCVTGVDLFICYPDGEQTRLSIESNKELVEVITKTPTTSQEHFESRIHTTTAADCMFKMYYLLMLEGK